MMELYGLSANLVKAAQKHAQGGISLIFKNGTPIYFKRGKRRHDIRFERVADRIVRECFENKSKGIPKELNFGILYQMYHIELYKFPRVDGDIMFPDENIFTDAMGNVYDPSEIKDDVGFLSSFQE